MDETNKYIANTYSRLPIVIVKGKGTKVWDAEGKEYLDFMSGLGVCNIGHCNPVITKAIKKQSEKLIHYANLTFISSQSDLARLLVENSFADKVFFCNSGAEANESAIKLTRRYSKQKFGDKKYKIITMLNSFHGRTMATLTATGQEKFQKGFEPLLPGFKYARFNDIESIKNAIDDETCAVMVEPIQGEGGVNIPSDNYLKELRSLCNDKGLLLIFDEVQVGIGRTCKLFAYEHFGVEPDIMTLAKSLGGGVPIGAMLAKKEVSDAFVPGTHASTFGGNPLAVSSAIAVLKYILKNGFLKGCEGKGEYIVKKLALLKNQFPFIKEIRNKGLIIGIELTIQGQDIVKSCLNEGLIINCAMGNVLRFLPPLTIKKTEIDKGIEIFEKVLKTV